VFVTVHQEAVLRVLWSEGVTVRQIGTELGLSGASICRHAHRLGLDRRSQPVRAADREEFRTLYNSGLTITEVASRTGFHRDTVRKALVSSGVTICDRTRRWPVRHDVFADPLSPEAWYWIGMLAADGCVRGPHISLIQHASRAAMLQRFFAFVGSPARPFRVINRGKGFIADVSSPRMAADLARHGVVPRKSPTMEPSQAAARRPEFWLGVFDGDGCCTFSKRGVPTIGIVGSRPLMTHFAAWLHAMFEDHRPAVGSVGRDGGHLSDVRVAGDRARRLAELWLSTSEVSLEPKRERLERAALYESRATRARLSVRRRRCDFCGASVERMPSQFHTHVFCSRRHYWAWRRRLRGPSPEAALTSTTTMSRDLGL
jgi:hypothetical protein